MNIKVIIVSIFILILHIQCSILQQKQIWLYWHQNFQNAPIFTKICYQQIVSIANKQKWKVTLVTYQTLPLYINNYTQFNYIIQNRQLKTIQSIGDYVKILLISHNGGVYFDITSIMINGFDWLLHLNRSMVTNYVQGVEPQVLMFYTTMTQKRNQYYYQQGIKNYIPGYGLYFLAGKKGSKALEIFKKSFQMTFMKTFQQGFQIMKENDIFFRNLEHDYYLSIDRALTYSIQKYQQQLDDDLTLFSKRKNSNQELKIWGLHSSDSTLAWAFRVYQQNFQNMFTMSQIKQKCQDNRYFMKYFMTNENQYRNIDKNIGNFFKTYKTFQNYMNTQPSKQQCQTRKFIVNGSIFGNLIYNNKQAQKYEIKSISVQQRQKWINYCMKYPKSLTIYKIIKSILQEIQFSYKHYYTQAYMIDRHLEPSKTILQKVKFTILEYRFLVFIYFAFFFVYLLLIGVLIGIKKIIQKCLKMFPSYYIQKIENEQKCQRSSYLILFAYFPVSIMLYCIVMMNGGVYTQESILLVYILGLVFHKWFFKSHLDSKLFGLSIQQHYNIIKTFPHYILIRSLLFSTQNRDQTRVSYAIFLALVFPQIIQIAQQVINNKDKTSLLLKKMVNMIEYYTPYTIVGLVGLFILIPNVKFIRYQSQYIIHKLFYLICIPLVLFYILVLYQVYKIVKSLQLQKIKKGYLFFELKIIFKFIFMSLLIYKCYLFNINYTLWFRNQLKIILDYCVMIIFIIINLQNCKIFSNLPNKMGNKGFLQSKSEENTSLNQSQYNQINSQQIQIESQKYSNSQSIGYNLNLFIINLLLFYLVPFILLFMRSIYRQNAYNYLQCFLSFEIFLIFINIGAILVWKDYLQHKKQTQ